MSLDSPNRTRKNTVQFHASDYQNGFIERYCRQTNWNTRNPGAFLQSRLFVASCPSVVWLLLSVVCCLLGVPLKSTSNNSPPRLANETRTTTSSAKLQVTKSRCCHAWQARPDNYGHGYERVSGAIHRTVKPANMTIRKVNTGNSRSGIGF